MLGLFNKEKDLIHRIANLILTLWLVIAVFVTYTNIVDLVVKKDTLSYSEYKIQYCSISSIKDTSTDESSCKDDYKRYNINNNDTDYYNKKSLVNGIGNIVIVAITLYLLNRKKD